MYRRIGQAIICLLFVALFIYAAIAKLSDYANFKFGLGESPFIYPFASFLAWFLPVAELVIAILICWPRSRSVGLYAATTLMLLFTIYISAMLLSSSDIPCSCGGVLEEMSWPAHIVFNCVFVILGITGIIIQHKKDKENSIHHTLNTAYAKGYITATDPH